jgi:hypothetical protein
VFLAAEAGFAGVEHRWSIGMTALLNKRWAIHEARMTGKISTADLPIYYQSDYFDKIIRVMVEKNVSWSPTIATWFRPLSPSVARFKEKELSMFNDPKYQLPSGGLARAGWDNMRATKSSLLKG